MDIPIMHNTDRYEFIRDIASGKFGIARLLKDKQTGDLVAVKYIERGATIDENVEREIVNHRSLKHPNIVRFHEVILTPTHLAIVMEYASSGALYDLVCEEVRFSEDKARYFFQQLISGVSYCHSKHVCHRDLKLENILLDGSATPQLKICDFGYSKSSVLNSQPNSRVGTTAYIAPEVITDKQYDGKIADVWSCGVTLYVMLVGDYPFECSGESKDVLRTIQRILSVEYSFPDDVSMTLGCRDLISRMLVRDTAQRITMAEIRQHAWFLKNLPVELNDENIEKTIGSMQPEEPRQSLEVTMQIISEARTHVPGLGNLEFEDLDSGSDLDDESSVEVIYPPPGF